MFNLSGSRKGTTCDGTSRRDFLKIGALGLGGFDAARPAPGTRRAAAQGQPTRNTSVVWLWLGGGPTHVETFDPKMTRPGRVPQHRRRRQDQRARHRAGRRLPEDGPHAPTRWPSSAPSRTRNSGHGGGTHWVMTGYDFPPADNGSGPDQARPRLDPVAPSRRQQPPDRPAHLRPPGRHPRRRPGLARLRLRPVRHRRQRPQQHEPQGRARPPGRSPLAAQDLRHARPRPRPQRLAAGPGQLRDAGLRPDPEPGARGLRHHPRRPARARPLRHAASASSC